MIDAVGARHGGAQTMLFEVLDAVVAAPFVSKCSLFLSAAGERDFHVPPNRKVRVIERSEGRLGAIQRLRWQRSGLRAAVTAVGGQALLCMSNGGAARIGIPAVMFIQQSLPFVAEARRRCSLSLQARLRVIRHEMRRSAWAATTTVVQTEAMRDLVRGAFGLPGHRVVVASPPAPSLPKGEGDSEAVRLLDASRGPSLLYVGNAEAYKNVDIVARAIRGTDFRLYVTWARDHALCKAGEVVGLGYVERSELRSVYERVDMLVHPSLAESLGLPLLEALALGVPVVVADRPYAREVCQDAAVYFDPTSEESVRSAIQSVLDDPPSRVARVRRGRALIAARNSGSGYHSLIDAVKSAIEGDDGPP